MKAIKNNNTIISYPELKMHQDIESFESGDFKITGIKDEKNQLTVTVYPFLFLGDNLKIKLNGNRITVIVIETVGLDKEFPDVFVDWQMYLRKPYVKMRSFQVLLPGDNFYLVRYYVIQEQFLLKIVLQQSDEGNGQ